jgi:hypothetical protein
MKSHKNYFYLQQPKMEARVARFQDLLRLGRPFKVFELVLLEVQQLATLKNRRKAAMAAHMSASFYGLPEMEPDWRFFKAAAHK